MTNDGRRRGAFDFYCSPQENIISPMEDSPIPDISAKDANDGAGTSPRSQGKAFRYLCNTLRLYETQKSTVSN